MLCESDNRSVLRDRRVKERKMIMKARKRPLSIITLMVFALLFVGRIMANKQTLELNTVMMRNTYKIVTPKDWTR